MRVTGLRLNQNSFERQPGSPGFVFTGQPLYTSLMPIYEYECRRCGDRFECLLLKSSPEAKCPSCQSTDLEQLISLCAVSSEASKEANLSAAHRKTAAVHEEKRHEEHKQLHHHFD
jgi:putative FmdB family regulatory protein